MNTRKITSLTLFLSFVLLMLTSIILYIVPHGRVAYWSDWHLWGISKTEWGNLHINLGVLFLIAFVFHLYFNFKMIMAYLKNKAKELRIFTSSFNAALLLTLLVCIGTYFMIPPMNYVIDLGNFFTEKADVKYGEPPYGHAELSSLKIFARRVNLDFEKAKELLDNGGITYENDKQTIEEIAKANKLTPQDVYEIMKPAEIKPEPGSSFPDAPPPGFGRNTLADICAEYNLHLPDILRALQKNNIKAAPENSIKDIAEQNGKEPMGIFEIIYTAVTGEK